MSRPGPAPLDLRLSADLAGVDPGIPRRRAAEHRRDADRLSTQAVALRTAVARLVPAAWLGLGALSFASAALLQAGSLEAIAAASIDLANALSALAAALEVARVEALDAVRAGVRLDAEVTAGNAALVRRPELERAEPDPAHLDAQFGAARMLASRLAVAEENAQRAWRQAGAAFDLVSYRMPELANRMSGGGGGRSGTPDGWQPSANVRAVSTAEWRSMVGASPVCVDAGYSGGGVLLGPDGRSYPLVVPWIQRDGKRWSADLVPTAGGATSLGGADPGWQNIGVRVGIDAFGPAASTATKAAIVTAGLAGNAPRMLGRLRPDLLPRLGLAAEGAPSLLPGSVRVAAPRVGRTAQIPRSALVTEADGRLRWVPDTSKDKAIGTRAGRREDPPTPGKFAPVGPNVIALAGSGLSGLDTARRLDDERTVAYRVAFEENVDGRIRARLTTYQVASSGSQEAIVSTNTSVATDGSLQREPVTYRPPVVPVMRAAPESGG
jgi:hypothetical protein